ncbi:DUF1850 domain-containing protein [Pseudonocardia nigra]|uniref:DUF1850 domain-containing protein n=1 Tax=Pseudonocardia nigra TaxID=1921578 RepID=UPI001C5F7ABA|nr:DUF1850 domain-containing protein [Pseudonocardia nigra]
MVPLRARLAAVACAVGVVAGAVSGIGLVGCAGAADAGGAGRAVTVRDAEGALLAQVPLTAGTFAVSYRNSIYRTPAEERYRVAADGRFVLVELAADQLAVLEEYYAVPGPVTAAPDGDRRNWVAAPDRNPAFAELSIAATALGERTLHVPGHPPVALPPLAPSDPTVVLDVEESS